jgi:hypothetical protein
VGKTQLGIQLALNIQIPEIFNGLGGEAVYIDTEGSFMVERVAEMATELSSHLQKLAKSAAAKNKGLSQETVISQLSAAQSMSRDRFLEGIQIFRVHDQTETIATINNLAGFLRLHTKVKLIVIDSIAFHFRHDVENTAMRSRVLASIAQTLNQLAYEHHVAVVVVNHVTTRFTRNSSTSGNGNGNGSSSSSSGAMDSYNPEIGDEAPTTINNRGSSFGGGGGGGGNMDANSMALSSLQRLIPALGEQWSHCITNRIMLYWHLGNQRRAALVKSPSLPFASVPYCVCAKGIRDIPVRLQ